jgi:hypothetical protein
MGYFRLPPIPVSSQFLVQIEGRGGRGGRRRRKRKGEGSGGVVG